MKVSVEEMQRRMAAELSVASRLAYTALLVVAMGVAGATASLWLTEPSLPGRTHAAFGVIVAGGVAWAAFAAWVLSTRRVLLARHRVIASRLAVTLTSIFVIGTIMLRDRLSIGAIAVSAVMLAVALGWMAVARRRLAQLLERRRTLEEA